MQVAMYVELGKVELQDVPRPAVGQGEVLVEIEACGLCATDVKAIKKGHPFWKPPRVMGHEMVGQVVEINGRTDIAIGDRVYISPMIPCGHCYFCLHGAETMCVNALANMARPGGFAEYVSCPTTLTERGLLPVPAQLDSVVASLAEPVGCAVRAMKAADFAPGSCVVVVGDGPMGMMNAAVARYYGAGTVILSGMLAHRLEIAATHYADITVNVQEQNLADVVHEVTQGYGADAVFVAVPAPAVVKQSLELVRPGGTFNIFAGQPTGSGLDLDLGIVHYKEISIKGTFGATPNQIYEALLLMASKRVDFSPIITKTYRLSQFMEAMEYSLDMQGLRAVIIPD